MRVFITGATGFIGQNLAKTLAQRGYQVKALVRSIDKSSGILNPSEINLFEGDITDIESLEKAIEPGDTVIHLAARFNDPAASYEQYRETNVTGTENLLRASQAKGVRRFIHCSTIGVAINSGAPPFDEDTPYSPDPNDYYEVTKCEGEQLVLDYHDRYQFPAVVLRPTQPFGPGDLKKVKFYNLVKKGIVIGNGEVPKHLIYIDDLVNGFILAMHKQGIEGDIFILGGEPVIYLKDMIKWAAQEMGVKPPRFHIPSTPIHILAGIVEQLFRPLKITPPLYKSRMEFFTKGYYFRTHKAKHILGFHPRIHIREGIGNTVRWYRENGLV